jgi:hypothetical protein
MGDAAHAGSLEHAVFREPFKIEPAIETVDAPDNYADRRLANEPEIPAQMPVWKVQETGENSGGVVSRKFGFEDSPDAEVLVAGLNFGKEYGAVGIGRHGNVLQWGYSAPPAKMTAAGRRLFLNCVVYIRRFDGKGVLVRQESSHRDDTLRLGALITRIRDKSFFDSAFSAALMERFKGDPDGLVQYFLDGYELIYRGDTFVIDEELRALGLTSNRQVETLEALVGMLSDREKAPAARRLLERYTLERFETVDAWRAWLDESRGRIYFSDVGGYKFGVMPEGYLE